MNKYVCYMGFELCFLLFSLLLLIVGATMMLNQSSPIHTTCSVHTTQILPQNTHPCTDTDFLLCYSLLITVEGTNLTVFYNYPVPLSPTYFNRKNLTCCYYPPLRTFDAVQTNFRFDYCPVYPQFFSVGFKIILFSVILLIPQVLVWICMFPLWKDQCSRFFYHSDVIRKSLIGSQLHRLLRVGDRRGMLHYATKIQLYEYLHRSLGDAVEVVYVYLKEMEMGMEEGGGKLERWSFCTDRGYPHEGVNFKLNWCINQKHAAESLEVKIGETWYSMEELQEGVKIGDLHCVFATGLPIYGHWFHYEDFALEGITHLELEVGAQKVLIGYCCKDEDAFMPFLKRIVKILQM